ncbi:MAG: DUF192 domain-containing protein [Bacteriovoracia bacterium]
MKHYKKFNAFIPWIAFWSQFSNQVTDLQKVDILLSPPNQKACESGIEFSATVTSSQNSREKGLSNREKPLASSEAMLFIFDEPQRTTFWMKDTLIPLTLIYFDEIGLASEVFEMPVELEPKHPKSRYHSHSKVKIALEISSKFKNLVGYQLCLTNKIKNK